MSWVVVVLLVTPVSSGSATNAIGYLCLRPNPVSAHRSFEIYFLHGIVSFHLLGFSKNTFSKLRRDQGWLTDWEEYNCLGENTRSAEAGLNFYISEKTIINQLLQQIKSISIYQRHKYKI